MKVSNVAKAVVAGVAAAVLVVQNVISDGTVTVAEGVEIGLALLATYGVYRVPNRVPNKPAE